MASSQPTPHCKAVGRSQNIPTRHNSGDLRPSWAADVDESLIPSLWYFSRNHGQERGWARLKQPSSLEMLAPNCLSPPLGCHRRQGASVSSSCLHMKPLKPQRQMQHVPIAKALHSPHFPGVPYSLSPVLSGNTPLDLMPVPPPQLTRLCPQSGDPRMNHGILCRCSEIFVSS